MIRRPAAARSARRRLCGRAGFTLVEVLVALAVVAVALGAMVRLMGDTARTAERLERRTLGHWVAMNEVALLEATNAWLEPGVSTGSAELGNRRWRWRRTVLETPEPRVRRVEVEVSGAGGAPVAAVTGFIGRAR